MILGRIRRTYFSSRLYCIRVFHQNIFHCDLLKFLNLDTFFSDFWPYLSEKRRFKRIE